MSAISRRRFGLAASAVVAQPLVQAAAHAQAGKVQSWPLRTTRAAGIHDVAPAPDGGVWFTAQASGHLGWFDPHSGSVQLTPLGAGSAPHGVIQGPDHAAWITDGGQNAIVRVSWPARQVTVLPLPKGTPAVNLNTCAFDGDGDLWFTGQAGWYGKVTVATGAVMAREAPRGPGAYGICATPSGDVWFCSLASSYIARIDRRTGNATVVVPPTRDQGARRIWSDSRGRLWVSEWNSGQLAMHDPAQGTWRAWKLPGERPRTYAVYVDERDVPWVSDFGGNAVLSFDPKTERFERYGLGRDSINVRQILGRPGEVWFGESGTDRITVIRT